jgi:hypothetical protein
MNVRNHSKKHSKEYKFNTFGKKKSEPNIAKKYKTKNKHKRLVSASNLIHQIKTH